MATRNAVHRISATTFFSLGLAVALAPLTSRAFAATPTFSHVFIVLEENHSYSQVVGNPSMPYLNILINSITPMATHRCPTICGSLPGAMMA
jgi:hypothetical protein